jgi:hypothetical protein
VEGKKWEKAGQAEASPLNHTPNALSRLSEITRFSKSSATRFQPKPAPSAPILLQIGNFCRPALDSTSTLQQFLPATQLRTRTGFPETYVNSSGRIIFASHPGPADLSPAPE